ncbi:hypothetical protein T484DRAFT_1967256 [Baffinella frigidus]|nr:hypothetical protein T484DRAFT_1967256 [Cryptophyta sp. CCMP2293]
MRGRVRCLLVFCLVLGVLGQLWEGSDQGGAMGKHTLTRKTLKAKNNRRSNFGGHKAEVSPTPLSANTGTPADAGDSTAPVIPLCWLVLVFRHGSWANVQAAPPVYGSICMFPGL